MAASFLGLVALAGCPNFPYDDHCRWLKIPGRAFRLDVLSSPYDDWNSCMTNDELKLEETLQILFSSNRATRGGTFDLTPMHLTLKGEDSSFTVNGGESNSFDRLLTVVNSSGDELGPSFWFPRTEFPRDEDSAGPVPQAFTFSRGETGSHDIHVLVRSSPDDSVRAFESVEDWNPVDLQTILDRHLPSPINSASDEGYATWSPRLGRILFHSNRSGKYRIWEASVPVGFEGPFRWLRNPTDSGVNVREIPELASIDGQERCPFLKGNMLYFVSDRSGGYGGMDVYRSRWNGQSWSIPENLGSSINSAYDEYRPFRFTYGHGYSEAILFSSNRPGGKGGFDLYLAGLNREN